MVNNGDDDDEFDNGPMESLNRLKALGHDEFL